MKTIVLTAALVLAGAAPAAIGQCANCQPATPTATAGSNLPQYVWIRQRRGLFGWRPCWVLVPVRQVQPVNVIGIAR